MRKIPMPEAPEGYEWIEGGFGVPPETWLKHNNIMYGLFPKQKKYDWSKTADYVWLNYGSGRNSVRVIDLYAPINNNVYKIVDCWLPHFGGPCPFDPEASIVELEFISESGGRRRIEAKAQHVNWSSSWLVEVRFVRLADGYTWGDE